MNACQSLTNLDKTICVARLSGESFCYLEGNNLRVATDKIIIKGAAIAGCPMPQTEGFAEILSEEVVIFINDFGYSELTLEEILLAFRINAKGNIKLVSGNELDQVDFVGSNFNITFMGKILNNYLVLRRCVDRKLQNMIDGY
jgi:hypothetical protein